MDRYALQTVTLHAVFFKASLVHGLTFARVSVMQKCHLTKRHFRTRVKYARRVVFSKRHFAKRHF